MTGTNIKDKSQDSHRLRYGTNETLLRSEIGFWKELILSSNQSATSTAMERMGQALALAECRLAAVLDKSRHRPGISDVSENSVWSRRDRSQH